MPESTVGPAPLVPLAALVDLAGRSVRSARVDPGATVARIRDLLYLKLTPDLVLVISCDSNAGVGNKLNDTLAFSPEATGRSVTQVALMEVLAVGATPLVVVGNLCVEMEPTGKRILAGVQQSVDQLARPAVVTGSDETNMPTTQTGVGVTVIAVASPRELLVGRCEPGDVVVAVGVPTGGPTHLYDEFQALEFADVATLGAVLESGLAHEILPVGSKGVGYELAQLAQHSGLTAELVHPSPLALSASGGASTCVLVALPAVSVSALRSLTSRPTHVVARLREPGGPLDAAQ